MLFGITLVLEALGGTQHKQILSLFSLTLQTQARSSHGIGNPKCNYKLVSAMKEWTREQRKLDSGGAVLMQL